MNVRLVFFLVFLSNILTSFSQNEFATYSVLKDGTWYKAKVLKTGIFKITYGELSDLGFSNPEALRIYSNSGKQLNTLVDTLAPDDLIELPLYKGEGFYVFYAEGAGNWEFNSDDNTFVYSVHDYATSNYLFLTTSLGSGKRVGQKDFANLSTNITISSYTWRDYYEKELYNLTQSGRIWVGDNFETNNLSLRFDSPNYMQGSDFKLNIATAIRSEFGGYLNCYFNGEKIIERYIYNVPDMNSHEGQFAKYKTNQVAIHQANNENTLIVEFVSSGTNDKAYLDYVFANTTCQLKYTASPMFFRDINSFQEGGNGLFVLSGVESGIQVWNISDLGEVYSIKGNLSGGNFQFKSSVDKLNEFVALNPESDFPAPVFKDDKLNDVGWLNENQNLHAMLPPQLLIVTHPLFKEPADSLANLHRLLDNMKVEVVTTEQVYNEFSSGKKDVSAIRNFSRLLWLRSEGVDTFKYLLLFGDGTYDNRNAHENNMNYIPTYQSMESFNQTNTYVTDDLFGQLEVGEFSLSGTLDIGVGRLPVSWSESAKNAVSWGIIKKINQYYSYDAKRDWRNKIIFLADDMEQTWEKDFVLDTEDLINILKKNAPEINPTKIYLDAFTSISTSTGASYPEVNEVVQEAFNKGALLFNYMGHGGENGITQEKIMQTSDFENLRNGPFYPVLITASCQVSRFDNVDISDGIYTRKKSAGEAALLNARGGAIALLTTTRVVFQSSNHQLSQSIFNVLFEKDEHGEPLALGDIYKHSKNNSTATKLNSMKFSLLGDPAIRLPYGKYTVKTDSINKKEIGRSSVNDTIIIDTVNALGHVQISGHICNDSGNDQSDFNGVVQVSVYDKEYKAYTRGNKPEAEIIEFTMQDKLLFRGNASVRSGHFSVEFIIPKDISYNYGQGRITYYAYNEESDAKGEFEMFLIGGTSDAIQEDISGPKIKLYMNDESFIDGGITDSNPILIAKVFDENGINTTGNGIGHDAAAFLDEDYTTILSLNEYFEGQLDDYKRGTIKYPLSDLNTGYHTISLKVWDTHNNSSDAEIGFIVQKGDNIIVDKLFNYPNPMSESTTFQYSHNMPGEHEVHLEVFDLSGRKVFGFTRLNYESGFVSTPIYWNRNNSGLLSHGVYPYRLTVRALSNEDNKEYQTFQTNKLIIIP